METVSLLFPLFLTALIPRSCQQIGVVTTVVREHQSKDTRKRAAMVMKKLTLDKTFPDAVLKAVEQKLKIGMDSIILLANRNGHSKGGKKYVLRRLLSVSHQSRRSTHRCAT